MDAVICTQHAEVPASWRCRECDLNYCSYCVPPDPVGRNPACLCCDKELESLGVGNLIVPFWRELPRFLRMPLETDTLLLMLGLALLLGLAGATASHAVTMTLVFALAALALYSLQGTRMLHRVAHGYLEPPLQPLPDRPGMLNVLKQSVLIVLLFGGPVAAAVILHSAAAFWVLLLLAILLLPAAFITLVTTDRLSTAVNPGFLISAALRIGWPYLLLWVLLMLISGGSGELHKLLRIHSSVALALSLNGLVSMYFGLVTMGLMGYVAFQHHEIFGQPVRNPYLESADGAPARELVPPDRAQLLISRGKIDEAQADLERRLRENPEQLELHALYQRLLAAKQDPGAAAHAGLYIGKLLAARRDQQAWRVYTDFAAKSATLQIQDGAECVRLAAQARLLKQGPQALPLLDKFAQRFPGHPDIPQAWLLTAQILTEDLHEDAKSRVILEALIKRYPDSPLRPEAERFAALLARLAASASRTVRPST